jgi:hypothetical protein
MVKKMAWSEIGNCRTVQMQKTIDTDTVVASNLKVETLQLEITGKVAKESL